MNRVRIQNHLFTTDHSRFNNRTNILSWWSNKNLLPELEQLQQITNFLPVTANITQRAYHVFHNLTYIPTCECGKNL